ncbi:MAG: thioredoxin domain-containing protein, partial [Elusimicrobia bacterium]|nr:thioredoxin domain-containing protein [Elusimicrobiota bacterium]
GRILGDERYLAAAASAANFVREKLCPRGKLHRRWAGGECAVFATADDYAFLIQGLLDLFVASRDGQWLSWAEGLFDEQKKDFWAEPGGFYMTAQSAGPEILFRVLEEADNVEPCASSVSALNALRLHELTGRPELLKTADAVLRAFSARMRAQPLALPVMLASAARRFKPGRQVILSGKTSSPEFQVMSRRLRRNFLPFSLVLEIKDSEAGTLSAVLPKIKAYAPQDRPAAYLCDNFACEAPIHDDPELERRLAQGGR